MSSVIDSLQLSLRQHREQESNLTYVVSILAKKLDVQAQAIVRDYGLNLTGYRILRNVQIFEQMSVSELSRNMLVDRAQISRSVQELEKKGLVSAQSSATNQRQKLVVLTPKGIDLMEELRPTFEERRAKLENSIGASEFSDLMRMLDTLSKSLD